MIFRKFLAAIGYIVSSSGAGATCWYLAQPKTIGEAITKIDTLSSTQEHFVNTWRLFKDDRNFMNWVISASNNLDHASPTFENDAAKIVKEYCKEVTELPLNEINIKELLPKALTWCTIPKQTKANVTVGENTSWNEITELIKEKGIESNNEVFMVGVDYSEWKRGLQRKTLYCWNKEKDDWEIKKVGEFCS
ncbi:hypothetical protein A6V39_00875 [Candidatus Mycoplasma haematobovis]|uniref:Lipoprotein n=1 Tax=Candidatus Mycoplasma haematobovis TaxID=432608 RepID=A0A1A9QF62_9MOLU|nr:hypothetical protein [Candidatus Mycoplasma haematobovis]OAL10605.1 hypothetical protein A6V39_00875 [Candidatus Mycoplasma haematobovis]